MSYALQPCCYQVATGMLLPAISFLYWLYVSLWLLQTNTPAAVCATPCQYLWPPHAVPSLPYRPPAAHRDVQYGHRGSAGESHAPAVSVVVQACTPADGAKWHVA